MRFARGRQNYERLLLLLKAGDEIEGTCSFTCEINGLRRFWGGSSSFKLCSPHELNSQICESQLVEQIQKWGKKNKGSFALE